MPDMHPIPVPPAEPSQPSGGWVARTLKALLVERRLPTRVAESLDRTACGLGLRHRIVAVPDPEGGPRPARLRVRRLTADPFFVDEIFVRQAYHLTGYEIGETDVVVDVGGNVGSFAVYAGRRARRGTVLTVEPAADSFSLLLRNVAGLTNVVPVRAAVAGRSGPVELHVSAVGTGHHSLDPDLAGPARRVEAVEGVTLEGLFARNRFDRCDLLKLDCEGAEFAILQSLSPDLAPRVRRVVLEYHTRGDGDKRGQADGLVARLRELGFLIDRYEDHLGTNRGMVFARRP